MEAWHRAHADRWGWWIGGLGKSNLPCEIRRQLSDQACEPNRAVEVDDEADAADDLTGAALSGSCHRIDREALQKLERVDRQLTGPGAEDSIS
jgi:hypothetical protein